MSIKIRKFIFENSFGNFYEVAVDEKSGTGTGRLLGKIISGSARLGLPMTSFVFVPENVLGVTDSYFSHAAIFGPANNQSLNTILNAS